MIKNKTNMKQTAVEWLAKQMQHPEIFNPYIEQAKEMEKEQIVDAYNEGDIQLVNGEQYYNENYKQD
jgi:hypothetical protein